MLKFYVSFSIYFPPKLQKSMKLLNTVKVQTWNARSFIYLLPVLDRKTFNDFRAVYSYNL